jgi:hypothetical protein
MLVVGYDDARQALKLMNSWGTSWGNGGYAWLAYDILPKVVREAYVVTDTPASEASAPPPPIEPPNAGDPDAAGGTARGAMNASKASGAIRRELRTASA